MKFINQKSYKKRICRSYEVKYTKTSFNYFIQSFELEGILFLLIFILQKKF